MDKNKLYLHVGMHKTGTTSIQTFLYENRERLRKSRIYFPAEFCDGNYKINRLRNGIAKNPHKSRELLKKISRQCTNMKCNSVILSDEDYYLLISKKEDALSILADIFDITIIVYLRRQDKQIESMYGFTAQYYNSRSRAFEWFRKGDPIDYREFFERCNLVFNESKLIVESYDNCMADRKNIISDFMGKLNIDIDATWKYPNKDKSNITPNKYIVEFLRRTNHIDMDREQFMKMKNYLINRSSISSGPPNIYLTYEDRLEYMDKCRESNEYVEHTYFNGNRLFPEIENIEVPEHLSDEAFAEVYKETMEVFNGSKNDYFYGISTTSKTRKSKAKDKGNLILHIGTPKTGSTSLQNYFRTNIQKLNENSIGYKFDIGNNNLSFAPLFLDDPYKSDIWCRKVPRENSDVRKSLFIDSWDKYFVETDFDNYIISTEMLVFYNEKAIERCKEFLDRYFKSIRIIVYVREPKKHINSALQQFSKNGTRTTTMRTRLEEIKDTLNYRFIERWSKYFGKENIIVRPFVEKCFHANDLVDDFFHHSGLRVLGEGTFQKKRANESIGKNSVTFLYEYNKKYPKLIEGEINEERPFANQYFPIIFNNMNDDKFKLDIKFSRRQARRINMHLKKLNKYIDASEHQFEMIKPSRTETKLPEAKDIPIEYFVELYNEMNRYFESKLKEKMNKVEGKQ